MSLACRPTPFTSTRRQLHNEETVVRSEGINCHLFDRLRSILLVRLLVGERSIGRSREVESGDDV